MFEQKTTVLREVQDAEATDTTLAVSEVPRPWYMAQGTRLPSPAKIGATGRRLAKLFPGEDKGADRIENQLMYLPPQPVVPGNIKKVYFIMS